MYNKDNSYKFRHYRISTKQLIRTLRVIKGFELVPFSVLQI